MIEIIRKVKKRGLLRSLMIGKEHLKRPYYAYVNRNAPVYLNPSCDELFAIERSMIKAGIQVSALKIGREELEEFKKEFVFPASYSVGRVSSVFNEKVLEHYISYKMAGLRNFRKDEDIYLDVGSSSSPWVQMLRHKGYLAYALDLKASPEYKSFDYYLEMDATKTAFPSSSVAGISLQCSFEMFLREDDTRFVDEVSRILRSGGKAIIVPLYMHTHFCGFSTQEFYNRGNADPSATEYVRRDFWGVPFARNYDLLALKQRVLDRIIKDGMTFAIYRLEGKEELGENIYCHFILEIMR